MRKPTPYDLLGQLYDALWRNGWAHPTMAKGLADALEMALEWIDAVPTDTTLPAMPGFDRDAVNDLLADYRSQNDG